MGVNPETAGPFEPLKCLLLDMANERSVDDLLHLIVERLADLPDAALARIWLLAPGDICDTCRMRPECADRSTCLHLVASAGASIAQSGVDWSRTSGDFRRFPIGARKIGHVAATGVPLEIVDLAVDSAWVARSDWAEAEHIRGICAQPLMYKNEVLGVLALFSRETPVSEGLVWLRMIADHAATAIANARAFEEIERLRTQLELENTYLREEVSDAQSFGEIVGQSSALRSNLEQIELVAPTDATVLILGESGTGKELVAREIHNRSARAGKPLIKVNCASIPSDLYESEFFGHARGAFTGAVQDRAGRFEAADGGTLFLDEIGEIPLELQSKLLRVLQEGQYERLGEERTRNADVRIIAATNRDLKTDVDQGRFRQDLYYRLNVFPLEVAPLRRRNEDIPALATHFLGRASRAFGRGNLRLTRANVLDLQAYDWPGNVRELQNAVERAVITSKDERMHFDLAASAGEARAATVLVANNDEPDVVSDSEMRRRDRDNIQRALEQTHWKIYGAGGAAELLDMKPTTLASRIRTMGIRKPR